MIYATTFRKVSFQRAAATAAPKCICTLSRQQTTNFSATDFPREKMKKKETERASFSLDKAHHVLICCSSFERILVSDE